MRKHEGQVDRKGIRNSIEMIEEKKKKKQYCDKYRKDTRIELMREC